MLNKKNYKIALQFKEQLLKVTPLIDFRVFGSRARGRKYGRFSDMDVFIEVEKLDKDLEAKINDITFELTYETDVFISPLIFTKDEIENSPLRVSPIVRNIFEEGIKV